LPDWHPLVLLQLVPQAAPLQRYGEQVRTKEIWQTPRPLQTRGPVSTAPLQLAAWQETPAGCRRQAPSPLQPPARPQVAGASAGHSFWGSCPLEIGVQVPALPVTLQAWQACVQELLQQKPSTHWPLAH
jgi:hypothetical protein